MTLLPDAAMSFRRSSGFTFRRLTALAWLPIGFAGVAASAAPAAHAVNLGVLVSCPFMEKAYASRNVATLSQYQRERTGWCTVNDARQHFGAPALRDQPQLQACSLGHASGRSRCAGGARLMDW